MVGLCLCMAQVVTVATFGHLSCATLLHMFLYNAWAPTSSAAASGVTRGIAGEPLVVFTLHMVSKHPCRWGRGGGSGQAAWALWGAKCDFAELWTAKQGGASMQCRRHRGFVHNEAKLCFHARQCRRHRHLRHLRHLRRRLRPQRGRRRRGHVQCRRRCRSSPARRRNHPSW